MILYALADLLTWYAGLVLRLSYQVRYHANLNHVRHRARRSLL